MPISKAKVVREVLLAFARVHILHHAAEGPVYGAGMMEELSRHGYRIGPGTLYPLLRRLFEDGLLSVQTEVVAGRRRKYYSITRKGCVALESLRPKLTELADEVLTETPKRQLARSRAPRRPARATPGTR